MHKKNKLLIAIAGAGLMGLLTGCGQDEIVLTPPQAIESSEPTTVAPPKDSSGGNINGELKLQNDRPDFQKHSNQTQNNDSGKVSVTPSPAPGTTNELVALTDTEETAKEIADLYDIELKSFAAGVAVYTTDKDPYDVIQMGIDNGYPTLSINRRLELH